MNIPRPLFPTLLVAAVGCGGDLTDGGAAPAPIVVDNATPAGTGGDDAARVPF